MTHTKWVLINKDTKKLLRGRKDAPMLFNSRSTARGWAGFDSVWAPGKAEIVVKSGFATSN